MSVARGAVGLVRRPRRPSGRGRARVGLALLLATGVVAACTSTPEPPPTTTSAGGGGTTGTAASAPASAASPTTTSASAGWPGAAAVVAENAKAGDRSWNTGVSDPPSSQVEGFVGASSVLSGEPITGYLHSVLGPVTVTAYRIGWYSGVGARLVWTSPTVTKVDQPAPTLDPATRTWSAANWSPSLTIPTEQWPPGTYLLRIGAANGIAALMPVTVRSPTARGAVVLLDANTTWQAYNHWGGTSLYRGKTGANDRAYAVSFDRPLDFGGGAGDFLGNELPVVQLAEKLGLPLAYATNIDLDADPHLLDGAHAMISLGHDEYYSGVMRDALKTARDSQGINLAFLGANAIYRHIRLGPTPIGPRRLETDYKDASLDPVTRTDPDAATSQWRQPPRPRPESELTGVYYQCNPVTTDMVVAQQDSWLFAGSGLKTGDKLALLVGSEFDQLTPSAPTPHPIEVLFHSPVTCVGHHQFSDAAYYTTTSGAGVFSSGSSSWICGLSVDCLVKPGDRRRAEVVTAITTNLLTAFAAGPAGRDHPAHENLVPLNITTATIRDITR